MLRAEKRGKEEEEGMIKLIYEQDSFWAKKKKTREVAGKPSGEAGHETDAEDRTTWR